MAKKNVLTAGKKLKADQAGRAGDPLRAQALFASVCKLDPMDTEAWTKLSLVEKGLGNFQRAECYARRALVLSPKLGFAHFALGQALHSQGQRKGAVVSYRTTIALMPDFADAHYLLGLALHEQGAMADAAVALQRALSLRSAFPEALAELGAVCLDLGQVDVGLAYLQRAAALRPEDALVLGNISHALRLQGEDEAAQDVFRHALRLAPGNVDLIAGLAALLEKQGEINEAEGVLASGLRLAPEHVPCNLVAAQLDRRGLRLQQAVDRLQGLLTPNLAASLRVDIMLALGQIYDQMGDAARAFPLIAEGKRMKALVTSGSDGGGNFNSVYLSGVARIIELATTELAAELRGTKIRHADAKQIEVISPVFLIGFPRSGTTLLEQILDSHPGIQTMEEKMTVSCMANRTLDFLDDKKCTLTELDEDQLTELRELYFAEASKHVCLRPGGLLVDKMPLSTVEVPIIAKVFPRARFVLAMRHPCDVCLSCLMQNFSANASMINFLTIEDTVHLYSKVMGAWLRYVELLPLTYHQIRYEDLVDDVAGESRKLLDFLGLPWDDAVLGHTEHARQRGAINTPSYHQVVQPIYQRSKYRWKRYEEQLADVLPVLQPFIERFGYA